MTFLISTEGKTRTQRIRNRNIIENLKMNTLKSKLINNTTRWHGKVLG
jgi:hypothetical protein